MRPVLIFRCGRDNIGASVANVNALFRLEMFTGVWRLASGLAPADADMTSSNLIVVECAGIHTYQCTRTEKPDSHEGIQEDELQSSGLLAADLCRRLPRHFAAYFFGAEVSGD